MTEHQEYERCKKENRPYIKVTKKRKYANVIMDMITCDRDLNHAGMMELKFIFRKLHESGTLRKDGLLGIGPEYVCCEVKVEDADLIKRFYSTIANNPKFIDDRSMKALVHHAKYGEWPSHSTQEHDSQEG